MDEHTLTFSPEEQAAINAQIPTEGADIPRQGIPVYSAATGDSNAVCGCCPGTEESRRLFALEKAIEALRGHGDADAIVKCAGTFEAFLKGDTQ